jgi:hypothetical protein
MLLDFLDDVNWLAVVVASVAWFILGAIWYAPPVLGRPWMRAAGIEMDPEGQRPGPAIYLTPLLAYLVAVVATAMIAEAVGASTVADGLGLGLVVGIGYALTLTAVGLTFDRKPKPVMLFLINGLFNVLGLMVAGVILAVWR